MGTPAGMNREPCPDRIFDDVGSAFALGAVGGSAFHFLKGLYSSPRGERFVGATQAVRMNVPRVGGSFAVWGGLFSTFDCSLVYLRRKEDPWNAIIAGASTSGLLRMRQGLRVASRSALAGAALLAMIEGVALILNRAGSEPPLLLEELPPGPGPQQETAAATSWFGNLFGGDKEEEKKSGGGVKTEILESFDSPPPPTFEFN